MVTQATSKQNILYVVSTAAADDTDVFVSVPAVHIHTKVYITL